MDDRPKPFLMKSDAAKALQNVLDRLEWSRGWTGENEDGGTTDRRVQLSKERIEEAVYWLGS
jgi:hypothetical protein